MAMESTDTVLAPIESRIPQHLAILQAKGQKAHSADRYMQQILCTESASFMGSGNPLDGTRGQAARRGSIQSGQI